MNVLAAFHAYTFTHFSSSATAKTNSNQDFTLAQKAGILLFGVSNPRPENSTLPEAPFELVSLPAAVPIEAWFIPTENARGTVILCHGYGGEKSSMLDKANIFRSLGYNTFLMDFRGAGNSGGNQTTIGYKEAQEVKLALEYCRNRGEERLILFGTSMGAVAIMHALQDPSVRVDGIILECPYGSVLQTVQNRFKMMGVPMFPMAYLLTFWGGALNGFNAFSHVPSEYAASIQVPTLLLYGEKDSKVTYQETEEIFRNLRGPKNLRTYPDAGHENYLLRYEGEWTADVKGFLSQY
ncbi:alpha/beta hydrolase [Rufibacter roseus]|uniref:Alpha/beta hydrolase n=2 Tax=Rufibacter roseus TaxID=1567108 RepID=A0ABW2DNI7_9BACT